MIRVGALKDETYTEVKAFSFRGRLLPRSSLETLAESRGIEDLVVRLKATQYNEAVSTISSPYRVEKLEMAFREHLVSAHSRLMGTWPRSGLLRAYYLKHIVWNLKSILKGKAMNLAEEDISRNINLTAEENLRRRDVIVKALSAGSLEAAIESLAKTEFESNVSTAFQLYSKTMDTRIFDMFLDKSLFEMILSEYKKLESNNRISISKSESDRVRDIVALDIDGYNVINLLRAKMWELTQPQIREILIESSFDIPSRTIAKMVATDSISEAIKFIGSTPYRGMVQDAGEDSDNIATLESAFEFQGYKAAFKSFRWQVVGHGLVLGITRLMELEVKNLSAIAFGVEQGLSDREIEAKLTFLF